MHASDGEPVEELKIPDCPVAVTSFGAAVCDHYLYVHGGNLGTAHSYSRDQQNPIFRRVRLEPGAQWEELGEVPRRQGNALVSHNNKLFWIGGFEARNEQGEEEDLVSTADFAAYDPDTNEWEALADLPEPRSSMDAVVLGDWVYVIGGWALDSKKGEPTWHTTAWKFDLSDPNGDWQPLAEPTFVRRANSVGFQGDKIYVLGGMEQHGGPTTAVAVYDPATDTWSDGPALPGDPMQGFGTSCFNVGGRLVVSTANGQILGLDPAGLEWQTLHRMPGGRFFHRLVGIDSHRFAVLGGTSRETGKLKRVDVFDLNQLESEATGVGTPDSR